MEALPVHQVNPMMLSRLLAPRPTMPCRTRRSIRSTECWCHENFEFLVQFLYVHLRNFECYCFFPDQVHASVSHLHVYELGFIEAIIKEFCFSLILFLLVLIYLHMSCCISVGSICKEESRPANWEPWIRPCWIRGPSLCFWTLYLLEALLFII